MAHVYIPLAARHHKLNMLSPGPPGIWLEALTMVSEIYSKSILQYRAYRARMQCSDSKLRITPGHPVKEKQTRVRAAGRC